MYIALQKLHVINDHTPAMWKQSVIGSSYALLEKHLTISIDVPVARKATEEKTCWGRITVRGRRKGKKGARGSDRGPYGVQHCGSQNATREKRKEKVCVKYIEVIGKMIPQAKKWRHTSLMQEVEPYVSARWEQQSHNRVAYGAAQSPPELQPPSPPVS